MIEVRNLFYNTPVRRTFLKSDSTEAGHVVEMFTRIALAHPTVHLTFRSGGKVVHDLPAVTGIKERIGVFFGRELADVAALGREPSTSQTHLWGYVGPPVAEPVEHQGPVPLRRRPVRPRPVARPRPDRGVPRPADGRPVARGVPPPGHPARGGGRQRPPDQGRGPVPRRPADLQPAPLDRPPDLPGQRPPLAGSRPPSRPAASPATPRRGARRRRRGRSRSPRPPTDRQDVASWFAPERAARLPDVPDARLRGRPGRARLGAALGPGRRSRPAGATFDEFAPVDPGRRIEPAGRRTARPPAAPSAGPRPVDVRRRCRSRRSRSTTAT